MKKIKNVKMFEHMGMFGVLLLLFIASSFLSPNFLSVRNLMNIIRQNSITGIVACGMMLVLITGGIDLSVASVISSASLIVAGFQDYPPIIVTLMVLAFGIATGAFNGVIISKFKVPPFIVTLGTMSVFEGIGLTYSKSKPISGVPEGLQFIGKGKVFGVVPVQGILFLLIAILVAFILKKTVVGRYIFAIGNNENAARLSGINTNLFETLAYIMCSLTAAVAGIVLATHMNVGEATLASGAEMDIIASCVIGGTSLSGGKGTAMGTVVGVFIIGMFSNIMNLLNIPGYTQPIFKGLVIVIAALVQTMQEQSKNSR